MNIYSRACTQILSEITTRLFLLASISLYKVVYVTLGRKETMAWKKGCSVKCSHGYVFLEKYGDKYVIFSIKLEHTVNNLRYLGQSKFHKHFFHMWKPCNYCLDQRLILMQMSAVLFSAVRLYTTSQCLLPSQGSKFLIPLSPIKFTTYDETVTVALGFIYQFLSHLPLAAVRLVSKHRKNTQKKTLLFITHGLSQKQRTKR